MQTNHVLTEEELHQLQSILLDAILEIDRICKKYHITYYLGGGTLLGAIRHHGFIPWDDDADLIMSRDDYELFQKVAPKELDAKYFFQDNHTDPGAHYIYGKVRVNDSFYVSGFGVNKQMHQGIFIDIFVHDNTSNHPLMQKLHLTKTLAYRAMHVATWSNKSYHRKPHLFYAIVNRFIRHSKVEFWDRKVYQVLTKYRKLTNANYVYDGTGEHIRHGVFPKQWLGTPEYVPFESVSLPVPKHYHDYLVYSYGKDYMTPPPKDKQISNHEVAKFQLPPYV